MQCQLLTSEAKLPARAHPSDAGLDLYSYKSFILKPMVPTKIPIGIAMTIPLGNCGLIWDRSSMGSKGIKVAGGVIDSSYRGEIIVTLINLTTQDYTIQAGDKIAQLLIQSVTLLEPIVVSSLEQTQRGAGGFGSTGV